MNKDMERLVSISEVSKSIGFSKNTTLRLLRASGLALYRVGKRKLAVRENDVCRWLEQRKISKTKERNDKLVE